VRKGIVPIASVALLVLLLGLGIESLAKTIATPLLYGLWILQLVLASVPQGVFWAIPLLVGLLLVLRFLLWKSGRREGIRSAPRLRPEGARVWADLLSKARERGYFRWRLAKSLSPLFLEAFAMQEEGKGQQMGSRVQVGHADLPEDLRAYLDAGASTTSYRQYLESRLGRGPSSPVDLDTKRIVQSLEDALDPARSSGQPRPEPGKTSPPPR